MKILATIQARMGSSRLPGKVLKHAGGQPLLLTQVLRLKKSNRVSEVLIATTTNTADDEIETFAQQNGFEAYRGSEEDVLQRITDCVNSRNADFHVECFGDSPLVDPDIVDDLINYFLNEPHHIDMVSNSEPTTFPAGLEINIYSRSVLNAVNELVGAQDPLREHVGYNIKRFPDRFNVVYRTAPPELTAPDLILEVDYEADLKIIDRILDAFLPAKPESISAKQIIDFCRANPTLCSGNEGLERRWKNLD